MPDDSSAQSAVPISEYAIIVNPDDNVAVVKNETRGGLVVALPDDGYVTIKSSIAPGHRFATRDVAAGEFVRQYRRMQPPSRVLYSTHAMQLPPRGLSR